MTNGIQLFYYDTEEDVTLDITDGLPIKRNVDWNRWCYDGNLSSFGQGDNAYTVRWTFSKYGSPVILNQGDRIGVRINDDLTDLIEHTIIAEGVHLGTRNPAWVVTSPITLGG